MHEVSIAYSIIELVETEAERANALKVNMVEVEIGSLAGVEIEALKFAWDMVTQESKIGPAALEIIHVKAKARCKDCGNEFEVENFFEPCPQCKSYSFEVFQGKELQVKSINIEN